MALTIKREQFQVLGAHSRQRFELDCVAELRRVHATLAATHDDEVLLRFVQHGIARARTHGFTEVADVRDWLALMLRLGPRFDQEPQHAAVQALLGDTSMSPQLRLAGALATATAAAAAVR